MKYKGKTLILDNFRQVLKDYTIDVQDVVRSAILDDIDIMPYIDKCSPYKLEQIRLALKEGLGDTFFSVSGDMLYSIRRMAKEGLDLKPLEKQLKSNLSEEHTNYVTKWILDGVNLSNINIALIPKRLLDVFDKGLRQGVDMSKFSKLQKVLSPKYIDACIGIEKAGKDCSFLTKSQWNLVVVQFLQKNADMPKTKWKMLEENLSSYDTIDRVTLLSEMVRNGIDIEPIQIKIKDEKGKERYAYDEDCLELLLKGYRANIDIKELMKATDYDSMDTLYKELELKKTIKVSGRLMKRV